MKVTFIGAAREVTGSKTLITTIEGKKILLDCGMFQGKGLETDELNRRKHPNRQGQIKRSEQDSQDAGQQHWILPGPSSA